jgi:hypothetical protein
MAILVAALLSASAAGCIGHSSGEGPTPTTPAAPPGPRSSATAGYACQAGLLFQLVPYAATDPYLPPGYHPRDPQAFLGSPAAFGQAGVLFIAVDCASPAGRFAAGSLDIFVEHPAVPALPADFDFYEVERFGDATQIDGVLQDAHWPFAPGTPRIAVSNGTVERMVDVSPAYRTLFAGVADPLGTLYEVSALASADVPLGPKAVRFWHDDPAGTGAIDYKAPLDVKVGPAYATARAGSKLAGFIAAETQGASGQGDPIAAAFPAGVPLQVGATWLPGVHAG